jgi:molybdopterin/thiamine biosynthesis adenylyltransferase
MRFDTSGPAKIVMLGAGGTGAHIAPNLYRLLYALARPARFIIADGDVVEEKNLVRQHFSRAELGVNKAKAVAERYAFAFGMAPEYAPYYIEDGERLATLLFPENPTFAQTLNARRSRRAEFANELVILIGAVDNNKSRKLCHEAFSKAKDLVYIDAGNGEFGGQVVCGVRRNGRTLRRSVGSLYPDVLADTDKYPSELSCAEASLSAPQAITANVMAAAVTVSVVYNIVALGESKTGISVFSTKSVNVKSKSAGPAKNGRVNPRRRNPGEEKP